MIVQLETIMNHYSEIISRKFNHNFTDQPGAGAAGGLGYAFSVFINSAFKRGINIVLETLNFKQYLLDAELVVTGEGRIDSQSERGKAPIGIINYVKQYNCRIIVIAGLVDDPKTFKKITVLIIRIALSMMRFRLKRLLKIHMRALRLLLKQQQRIIRIQYPNLGSTRLLSSSFAIYLCRFISTNSSVRGI